MGVLHLKQLMFFVPLGFSSVGGMSSLKSKWHSGQYFFDESTSVPHFGQTFLKSLLSKIFSSAKQYWHFQQISKLSSTSALQLGQVFISK